MDFSNIIFEKRGHIAIITLNRPKAMNSINAQTAREAGKALEMVNDDPDIWVGILTGAGDRSFCAGADLKAVAAGENIVPDDIAHWGFAGIVQHYISKPVIAAVNGFALGGGTEIALSCDLVVASEKATFGLPEVKRGIIAGAGGLLRLPRQIPMKVAVEAIFTGKPLSPETALQWGLINRVVPHESLLDEAISLAEEICENAPLAVRISKDIIYKGLDVSLDHPPQAWEINESYLPQLMNSEDAKEGPRAFAEKRMPVWKGC